MKFLLPKDAYTPWITRVAATVIDAVPFVLILVVGWVAGEVALDCGQMVAGRALPGYCGFAITEDGPRVLTRRENELAAVP